MAEPRKRGLDVAKRDPQVQLRFIVVGGSLSGLATAYGLALVGHQVCVLEQSSGAVQSSNGVTCPPNMTKILKDWGLQTWIDQVGSRCGDFLFTDSRTGERLGKLDFDHKYSGKIDADYYYLMYDDLYYKLRGLAESEGVRLLFNTRVVEIDPDAVEVTLDNGERLSADVVIGADGPSGVTRSVVNDEAFAMGVNEESGEEFLALGYTIPTELLARDPEFQALTEPGYLLYWLGDRFLISASLAGPDNFYITIYSPLDTSCAADLPNTQDWSKIRRCTFDKLKLKNFEDGIQTCLTKLLNLIENLTPLRYVTRTHFDNAVDETATVCLVGDAGHPLIPYAIHSAALGLEDASTLLHLFSGITRHDQIPRLMSAYEEIRQPRWETVLQGEILLRHELSLPPGPLRKERDKFIASFSCTELQDELHSMMIYEKTLALYDYDVVEAVDDWYSKWEAILLRPLDPAKSEGEYPP